MSNSNQSLQQINTGGDSLTTITSSTLFLSNFPKDTSRCELMSLLTRYGEVIRLDIIAKYNQIYAFVEYDDMRDAVDALHQLNKINYKNYRLRVEYKSGKSKYKKRENMAFNKQIKQQRKNDQKSEGSSSQHSSQRVERQRSRDRNNKKNTNYSYQYIQGQLLSMKRTIKKLQRQILSLKQNIRYIQFELK